MSSEPIDAGNATECEATDSVVATFEPESRVAFDRSVQLLDGAESDAFVPPFPENIEDLGISRAFLTSLALKAVTLDAEPTTTSVADRLRLGLRVTDALLQELNRQKLIETKGVIGLHNHRYAMLDAGWTHVARAMSVCSYVGPAPVSLADYSEAVLTQVRRRPPITQHALDHALGGLVLSDAARQAIGLVASTRRSLFLSGPSGNGKSAMARALASAITGDLWIPYAIEVDGQVIRLYDAHNHVLAEPSAMEHDRRWVKVRAPLMVVGGEMTLESMELTCSETQRFYEAPFQLKANGGVLVVDDFGRQRCSPDQLLNRWIIPLESRVDYLTLSTGKKIQVPFEEIVVFATNLTVSDVADEAFLRRMGYRLYVMPPGPETYAEIFKRYASTQGLSVSEDVLTHLDKRYGVERREPKACEPRDLVDRAVEICKFRRETIRLTKETLDAAWAAYFGASASG